MNVRGDPSVWADLFPDGLIGSIIDLILDTWPLLAQPRPDEREVPITRRFVVHLRAQQEAKCLPFLILRESPEDDAVTAEEIGRIDIRFVTGYRLHVYFSFECKRLNVTTASGMRSRAGEYVREGMNRYVEGTYARGLRDGGMLGYVMDGNVDHAIEGVRQTIHRYRKELQIACQGLLEPSSFRPQSPSVKETNHRFHGKTFRMHHVFLGVR